MSSKILIIYEGEKTEKVIFDNIKSLFFERKEMPVYCCSAGENIYMLWKTMKEDNFQTDIVEIIKEYAKKTKRSTEIDCYSSRDFSEIYLFFDYDRHVNNLGNSELNDYVISEMLKTFSDETDMGKLYINYPMVESMRDTRDDDYCYRRCTIPVDCCGDYKRIVSDMTKYQNSRKYAKEHWKVMMNNAIRKANCIVNNSYKEMSRADYINGVNQKVIFDNHLNKFVNNGHIAVLSSIPLFLLEYFKEDFWNKNIEEIS